ncbi:excinuclease ABC subunit UvrB [Candidatus Borkfalkia ceftriaxoniphila]|uniref:UvrABC system protein B n=1 Tax=Candidatus Borkfalkia ceftriaxoniphila TaxID=2508949 RepID=A0A4Q2KAG4_9FIRM|nr:excinuclease ABC subunit UvrB [Candidatus Borkfalkia ceftriaxoniphila]RXZ58235.1 excinuclease ABC subunit UvrB [Candidatus Borkfalkia ceftriaxoniphila]
MADFELVSPFQPTGDQPQAIEKLTEGVLDGIRTQVLVGVTGSGKTFTMANIVKNVNRPTLVIAHNKTLAAQLCNEFREFFPKNRVEYFVSYYDYYQPESYIPTTDTYIEKDMSVNDEIDKLRNSTTCSLGERSDVLVVASVSCIYGLGAPEEYFRLAVSLRPGDEISRDELMRRLIELQYTRKDVDFSRSSFRVNGDTVEIFPASNSEIAIRVEFFGDEIDRICEEEVVSGKITSVLKHAVIFPASHYAVGSQKLMSAITEIESDLQEEVRAFQESGKLLEAQRLDQRTRYDIEMMKEVGYCSGVENYSRYFDGRKPGQPSFTLLDYFPENFLVFIDESHMTIPQIRAMYHGDYSRKTNLVNYGFRMRSAFDNRPLKFEEFDARVPQLICVSATPAEYELKEAGQVVEQIIRPTGLLDPEIEIRPVQGQIDDLLGEIKRVTSEKGRVLITTLTKRMSESLTDYLKEHGVKVRYMHSDIDTLERIDIVNGLRGGEFDVLCGINLLREGLDLPEVRLVAILDADKEGFLRSETSLIQTIGRAARNADGKVIMYADNITGSMRRAIDETNRRREVQSAYNREHNITPRTIQKEIKSSLAITQKQKQIDEHISADQIPAEIEKLKALMKVASNQLDFEKAIEIRDTINLLKRKLRR